MIYLDAAATTLQKPPEVAAAVASAVRELASPGRGGYAAAERAAELAYRTRELAAELFSVSDPARVIFTPNATAALNLAIKGLTRPGDEVVISSLEHNAVVRPVLSGGRRLRIARVLPERPGGAAGAFAAAIGRATRLCVCTLASNVSGVILPCEEIGALCARRGIPFVVDASQAAGVLPVSLSALRAEAVCMPGHKGLYGPQGTGLLLLAGRRSLSTLIEGGTGVASASLLPPRDPPERFESGTHNMPGIAGLFEGLHFVSRHGETAFLLHERRLRGRLWESVADLCEAPAAGREEEHTGVLALRFPGHDCEWIAARLAERGISVRAGLCCAPLANRAMNTFSTGVVRFSPSFFNTEEEIDAAAAAIREILRG